MTRQRPTTVVLMDGQILQLIEDPRAVVTRIKPLGYTARVTGRHTVQVTDFSPERHHKRPTKRTRDT
jgi:hypothetical protein